LNLLSPNPKISFKFFTGELKAGVTPLENPLAGLPDPPPWRSFGKTKADWTLDNANIKPVEPTKREQDLAEAYLVSEKSEIVNAVNAALLLRRPLLVAGPPGSGKSSLIYAIARELRLGPVLAWNINSRSTLREGLYTYDALDRLQKIQARVEIPGTPNATVAVSNFVRLGPLGTALVPSKWPKALLIDEIDKADLDLPNDLLNLFEEGKFTIEEIYRESGNEKAEVDSWKNLYGKCPVPSGEVACTVFPFILMTSNREREFSGPFLRRCIRLDIEAPKDKETLAAIVNAHLKTTGIDVETEAQGFLDKAKSETLSTDQLMNAIFILENTRFPEKASKEAVLKILYRSLQ